MASYLVVYLDGVGLGDVAGCRDCISTNYGLKSSFLKMCACACDGVDWSIHRRVCLVGYTRTANLYYTCVGLRYFVKWIRHM